jgi:signal transduction histidine kinase
VDSARRALGEEAALRRVATLVAHEASPSTVLEAIAVEAGSSFAPAAIQLVRYERDRSTTVLARCGAEPSAGAGRWTPQGASVLAAVLKTGRPARTEQATDSRAAVARASQAAGLGWAVGVPIVVDGETWGALLAVSPVGGGSAANGEARLAEFADLAANAVANGLARNELRDLAEMQGSLRRVATLVAQGAEPKAVFVAVAAEAARVLRVGAVSLIRFDPSTDMFTKIFGTHGPRASVPDGGQWSLEHCPEGALIQATGQPVRIDDWTTIPGPVAARHREDGFGQAVAAPIVLEGAIWGHIAAFGEAGEVLPPGCEERLADFTNLVATAIANAQARDELRSLAESQGDALRRVAALVGQQASQSTIFDAVAAEASQALGVEHVNVVRYEDDGSATVVGATESPGLGSDEPPALLAVVRAVHQAGRAARIDDCVDSASSSAAVLGSAVGAPIVVDGATWGAIAVLSADPLPPGTRTRLTDFTHLVASSISNVHARNKLIASRARIVTASDETRRRIERNIHDGIQQRIVALGLSLRAVREQFSLPDGVERALDDVETDLDGLLTEIRDFSRGLHPTLLSRAGLGPSLRALARRSPIPVTLEVAVDARLPEPIEIAVYYVVSEALANVVKHAQASSVTVAVSVDSAAVKARVADDGVGGAAPGGSSGLIGLVDRVEALDGRFQLESRPGHGTTISIILPLEPHARKNRILQ